MDQFGVLVESIGFKAQGQSAPLAKLKSQPNKQQQQSNYQNGFPQNISSGVVQSKPLNNDPFFVDDLDVIFRSSNNNYNNSKNTHDSFGGDDVFGVDFLNLGAPKGVGIDLDAVFPGNPNSKFSTGLFDDFMGNIPKDEDIFGLDSTILKTNYAKNGSGFDDLIHGFGGNSTANDNGASSAKDRSGESSSAIDELEEFAKGGQNNSNEKSDAKISIEAMREIKKKLENMKGFEKNKNANIEVYFPEKDLKESKVPPETKEEKTSPTPSDRIKKPPPSPIYFDDFSFFGEPSPSAIEFKEIEGEPPERKMARLKKHMETKMRMAKALDEKNQRDIQAQHEQEEKRRLSETLDDDIKRWAAGKEINLRALLSSLQYVLWPDSGWQPVGLTDLITSVSVKKVYLKATLYVHPDKVQQKGAKQKYIAERVFDVLKEAWNKFNAEELR